MAKITTGCREKIKKRVMVNVRGVFLIFLFIFLASYTQAQRNHPYVHNWNNWMVYNGDHPISKKWGIHQEIQLRRSNGFSKPQQLLLRVGINYQLHAQVMLSAGYCFVETYPYGKLPVLVSFPEHRLWQQIQVKTMLSKIEWISRFRSEQRFSKLPTYSYQTLTNEPGEAVYTNRFRLLNRISLPIVGSWNTRSNWFVSVADEVFIQAGREVKANFFDQNRLYGGIGFRWKNYGRLEFGYLEQSIIKSDGLTIENNHTFQFALNSGWPFSRRK